MSIEPIGFLPPSVPILPTSGVLADATSELSTKGVSAFGQWFSSQVQKVNGELEVADKQLQDVATGEAQNLHQVMISLEEARLSFQLMVQVRNRVLEAYQDVMRMQV